MMSLIGFVVLLLLLLVLLYFVSQKTITLLYQTVYHLTHSQSIASIIVAIIFFPGTVIHELAHFCAAAGLMLKVHDLYLLPEWDHQSIKLGHVTYSRRDPIRGFLVGIAPLFAGVAVFATVYAFELLSSPQWWIVALTGYLLFAVSSTMFSSRQDLIDAGVLVPILIIGGVIIGFLEPVRVFLTNLIQFGISGRETLIGDFFTSAIIITGLSIGIHLGILAVGSLIQRR